MKRYIIAVLAVIGLAGNVLAQNWTGKGNTVAEGDYYLYNVKSGKYLTWGTNYGTRASLVQQAGEIITLTASGSGYTITIPDITKTKKGLFLNSSNIPFCDNDAAEFIFAETSAGSKVYTISSNSRYLACRSDYSAEPSPLETTDNATNEGATWMLIKKQDRIDALNSATASNPVDATFFIKGAEINENFDNAGAWEGTDPTFDGRKGNLEATGFAAENYWGASVESYQILTGLPAGKYRLSCYGFYRDGSATDAGTKNANGTEDIKSYLFAGSNQTPLSSIMEGSNSSNGDGGTEAVSGKWVPNSMAEAVLFFFRGRYPAVTVDAIVGDDGQLKIGIRKDAGTEQKWTIWDRFRLTYYGDDLTSYAEALSDAVNAANAFIDTHVVPAAAENAITLVINENNKEYTTKTDYINATQAINDAVALYNTDELKAAYAAYKAMRTDVQELENTTLYKYTDPGTAKSTFDDAVSSANTAVEGATTASAINTQTGNIRAAALTFVSSVTAEDGNPFNLTFLASTAAADWQTASGLNPAATAPAWSVPKPDASMADFVESYTEAAGGESITGNILYQTVSGMPTGYYTVALYAAASYTPNRGSLVVKCTDGQPNITFGFAGDNSLSLPVAHRTSLTAADQVPVNLSVQLTAEGPLTFGIKKTAAGSNWHVAQIYTITYSKDPDLTVLKADRDALVSEAEGLLASGDASLLTTAQQNALSTAIATAEAAVTFETLTEVTLNTLPNTIQTARQQIQLVKDNRVLMIAALERFERDYNLADGTDYSRQTMSADAWASLITKVNAVSTALDDVSQATSYGTLKDALIAQMDATDASLRLFKSYKAMADGVCSVCSGITAADSEMDTDDTEQTAITAYNTTFINYALAQDATINMAAFLGDNLDFSAAEGAALNTENNNIHAVTGWEVNYADADQWAVIQTHQSDNDGKLYMRKNWGSSATTLTATKEKMLPVGKYTLTFSWNSDLANMTNRSQYKLGDTAIAIGENTNGTLTYEFEITGTPQPFDLTFGFQKIGEGNTPAQIVVDDVTLTYTQPTVTLADNAANDAAIANNDGYFCNVKLDGRTLYKDDSWNTLCLPFSMTAEQVTAQLAPSALMELDKDGIVNGHTTGLDGSTLYLNFKAAESIKAGTPYIIKWSSGDNIANPTFRGVTVTDGNAGSVTSTDDNVTFQGTYAPVPLTKDDKTSLYIDAGNTLSYPTKDDFKVNAFRAYFHLSDPNAARSFVLNFGDETTGISEIVNSKSSNGKYFTVGGTELQGKPSQRGIYIQNGRKVVIK